ncbi:MAG: hypothetical protein R6U37_02330 [Dehalococcoidia bacterium]
MTTEPPQMPEVPRFTCPRCGADLVDPENPYCEKCDIAWVECPGCHQLTPPGRGTCEACGMSIPDKGV